MTPEQKLSNEEEMRIFAMYLDAKILYNCYGEDIVCKIVNVGLSSMYVTGKSKDGKTFNSYGQNGGKLLLTPLSAITDEHAGKLEKLEDTDYSEFMNRSIESDRFQQLIIWGYAVPLFFGIDHWANSKTAIELGIAIAITQL